MLKLKITKLQKIAYMLDIYMLNIFFTWDINTNIFCIFQQKS